MSKRFRRHQRQVAQAKRAAALDRRELGERTVPRVAAGVTSMPVKVLDPETQTLIAEWLERRGRAE